MFLPDEMGRKYDHLKQAEAAGAVIPELKMPAIDQRLKYIFDLWVEISGERDQSFSIQPLKIRDIMLWAQAFRVCLTPFEIQCIQEIDREFVKAHGHRKPKHQGNTNGSQRSRKRS